jgi:hypothetical protein
MAATITIKRDPAINTPSFVVADFTGDNPYPAGGYPLTPAQFNLADIWYLAVEQNGAGSRLVQWDNAAWKLKLFTALGAEAAGDQSAITCRLLAVGPHA